MNTARLAFRLALLLPALSLAAIEDVYKEDFPIGDNFGESLLEELLSRPIDINQASLTDLLKLPGVEEVIANNIIQRRKEKRGFKRLEELREVKGMTEELWQEIIPFLTLKGSESKFSFKCRTELKDLQRKGDIYNLTSFGGGKDMSFHFLSESDYREAAFDFTSFNLTRDDKRVKFILGDFLPILSELLFSPPYYSYYRRHLRGWRTDELVEVKFAAETHYFRGFGVDWKGNYAPFLFFSSKNLTAEIDTKGLVKRILYSGLHSDSLSRAKKGNLAERSFGAGWGADKKAFRCRLTFLFNQYNKSLSFGRGLFSLGANLSKEIASHLCLLKIAKSSPGSWGLGMRITSRGGYLNYTVSLYYIRGDFFSLYGKFPNISPARDRLFYDAKLTFTSRVLPARGRFTLSYNTRADFAYDSLRERFWVEWERRGRKAGFRIYQRRYIGKRKRGSGIELEYKFSPGLSGGLGIEDKYQDEKRGFKFAARMSFSYRGNIFSLHSYKTILSRGINFYHFEPEGYKENNLVEEEVTRIILGWSGKIIGWQINIKLGMKKKGKLVFDFKKEIKR